MQNALKQTETLIREGNLKAAQPLIGQLLKKHPKLASVNQLAGLWMHKARQSKKALTYYNKALKLEPDDASTMIAIASLLVETKEFAKAREWFAKAEKLQPDNAMVLIGLGQTYAQDDKKKALEYFERAFALMPELRLAQDHYLFSYYRDKGTLEGVENPLLGFSAEQPAFAKRYFLSDYYLQTERWDALHDLVKQSVTVEAIAKHDRAWLVMSEFIGWFLQGKLDAMPDYFALANHLKDGVQLNPRLYKNANAFYLYLLHLLQYRKEHADLYQGQGNKKLHAIGDSHVLGVSGLQVKLGGEARNCQSHIILGAKAFHMREGVRNRYRAYLEYTLSRLPASSDVLLMMGEIDCRADEGIAPFALNRGLSLPKLAAETASGYVNYLASAAKSFGHRLLFCTVPPISPRRVQAAQREGGSEHIEMVKLQMAAIIHFNEALKRACGEKGCTVVDAYEEVIDEKTLARPDAHLEMTHLHPHILKQVIEKLSL